MLHDEAIVCFAPDPSWQHLWRNRHQIMTRLARHNRVLFVEPTPYLRPVGQAVREQGLAPLRERTFYSPMPNLWVYRTPNLFPISGKAPLRQVTFALRRAHLRRVLTRLNMTHPILWVFRYDLGEMVGHLQEKLFIYHAVDAYAGYALSSPDPAIRGRAQRVVAMERDLVRRADLVFVSSANLLPEKRAWNPNTYHVPNGVDYARFASPPQSIPADIAQIPRPRIGYAGAINAKLDFSLLEHLARTRPDWQLVLVGPILLPQPDELNSLRSLPNVHFLGRKTVEALPGYMHQFDVALMPYARNPWTEHINPLKLYEYLATGRPIVTTPIPAVQDFSEHLSIADNESAFVQAVAQALDTSDPAAVARRQAVAREHTWDRRVETLSTIIQAYLFDL